MFDVMSTTEVQTPSVPRVYTTEDFRRWGAAGGKAQPIEAKRKGAKARWAKAKRKKKNLKQ